MSRKPSIANRGGISVSTSDSRPTARCLSARRLPVPSLLSLVALLLGACARIADPLPPVRRLPQPTDELAARQIGSDILLVWPPPSANTDGSPVALGRIDIYRTAERQSFAPPANADDFAARATRIASIPAADIARYTAGGKIYWRDSPAFLDRSLIFRRSFRYAVKFVNPKGQDAGFSNIVWISPVAIPGPPVPIVSWNQEAIELRWSPPESNLDGSRPPKILGYNVYKGPGGGKLSDAPINRQIITDTHFLDRDFEFEKSYSYAVSVVSLLEPHYAESDKSVPVTVTPVDKFPPAPPEPVAFPEAGAIVLVWSPGPELDIAGYNIYRAESAGGPYRRVNPELVLAPSYRDVDLEPGRRYFYVVRAVDNKGNESGNSIEVSETAR